MTFKCSPLAVKAFGNQMAVDTTASCMNNNIPYFNAQSRWCITKRIMELSDIQYNIQKFMENDQIPPIARTKSVFSPDSKPLGSPILIRR